MENIDRKMDLLIEAIKDSNEYNIYHTLLETLKMDLGLYNRINEFREKTFRVQLLSEETASEQINQLREDYQEVLRNKKVSEFIVAEQKLCSIAKRLNYVLLDSFNINIDFL